MQRQADDVESKAAQERAAKAAGCGGRGREAFASSLYIRLFGGFKVLNIILKQNVFPFGGLMCKPRKYRQAAAWAVGKAGLQLMPQR